MGVVLDKEIDPEVIDEFQKCHLYPHDTAKVKQLFCDYRTKRIRARDNQHFGVKINAKQLSEWSHSDINSASKLINRWKPTIGIKKSKTEELLNTIPVIQKKNDPQPIKRRNNLFHQSLSSPTNDDFEDNQCNDKDTEITMMPIFCAMTLISSGKVSDKLRLIIYFFEHNHHDSISREELNIIIENTILAISVLLNLTKKHYISKLRRNAKRHVYQKNCNNSTTFNKISRGTLAVWLATSPYILYVFCLYNTSDATQRNKFIRHFYQYPTQQSLSSVPSTISITLPPKKFKKNMLKNVSVPNLAAINNSLKGTHLDFSKEQSINRTLQSLSHSYSAKSLRRNIVGMEEIQSLGIRQKKDPKFQRVDSFSSSVWSKGKRASIGNKRNDDTNQYYGGSVPFDIPPISIDKILNNFEKHYKLSLKVQSKIRAPALVNQSNVKSVVEGFKALSNGKDYIEKKDMMMGENQSVVRKTLERIFKKCDIKRSLTIDVQEFVYSQFGNANNEELDRAMSFNGKPPKVYGWTVQIMKLLFDKLAYWLGVDINNEPRVPMNEFYALCIHCKELREYVIRTTRLKRSRMKKLVTFKECCLIIFEKCYKFNIDSEKTELIWIWILRLEPGLNEQQKIQLKLLYDSMEQRSDGTISQYQLQNATDWILPNIFNESLLSYLFYKFHGNHEQRVNCNEFLYFIEYIWFVFQREFTKRKLNKMMKQSKFGYLHQFRTTLTPTSQHKLLKNFQSRLKKQISIKSGSGSNSKPNTSSRASKSSQSQLIHDMTIKNEYRYLINYAQCIKEGIENRGNFMTNEAEKIKNKNYGKRYWSTILRKGSANKAWMRLVFLAIRVQDIEKRESRDESVFAYMNALENVDVKTDFKFTKYYSL